MNYALDSGIFGLLLRLYRARACLRPLGGSYHIPSTYLPIVLYNLNHLVIFKHCTFMIHIYPPALPILLAMSS